MQRHLKLVESDFESLERRVLPSFPFCYLIFKSDQSQQHFEIKDISRTGMQLVLKDGEIGLAAHQGVEGTIHWMGSEIDVHGQVKWVRNKRMGVEFSNQNSFKQSLLEFLSLDNFVNHMKPVHQLSNMGLEVPGLLKYWLRADGPVELFVWNHPDGDVARFQIIIMENFVEWEDGKGVVTGRVISKRDIDTPLIHEDEFVFRMDQRANEERVELGRALVQKLKPEVVDSETKQFLARKLGQ